MSAAYKQALEVSALGARPGALSGWQPIETAPKDGSNVLVNDTTGLSVFCMAHYLAGEEWEGWVYDDEISNDCNPLGPQPTHFIVIGPLPPAPNQGEAS